MPLAEQEAVAPPLRRIVELQEVEEQRRHQVGAGERPAEMAVLRRGDRDDMAAQRGGASLQRELIHWSVFSVSWCLGGQSLGTYFTSTRLPSLNPSRKPCSCAGQRSGYLRAKVFISSACAAGSFTTLPVAVNDGPSLLPTAILAVGRPALMRRTRHDAGRVPT